MVARAKTGSGKTYAYLLPMLQKLFSEIGLKKSAPSAFILVPTRELCQQVVWTLVAVIFLYDLLVENLDWLSYIDGFVDFIRSILLRCLFLSSVEFNSKSCRWQLTCQCLTWWVLPAFVDVSCVCSSALLLLKDLSLLTLIYFLCIKFPSLLMKIIALYAECCIGRATWFAGLDSSMHLYMHIKRCSCKSSYSGFTFNVGSWWGVWLNIDLMLLSPFGLKFSLLHSNVEFGKNNFFSRNTSISYITILSCKSYRTSGI